MLFSPPPPTSIEFEPLISIQLFGHKPAYQPRAILRCDYQIDAVGPGDLQALEASVLWFTDGKGDEDIGVHFFERRVASDIDSGDIRELRSISVELPNSPLSYEGEIVQIHWCVRVRAFLRNGRELTSDHEFQVAVLDRDVPLDQGRRAPGVLFDATNVASSSFATENLVPNQT